jgi:hypothetical protein
MLKNEKELQGLFTDEQWKAFKEFYADFGFNISKATASYGSDFLTYKAWFGIGWAEAEKRNLPSV